MVEGLAPRVRRALRRAAQQAVVAPRGVLKAQLALVDLWWHQALAAVKVQEVTVDVVAQTVHRLGTAVLQRLPAAPTR